MLTPIALAVLQLVTWIIRSLVRRPVLPGLFPLTLYLISLALTVGIYNHFHTIGHPRRDAKGQVAAGWSGQDLGGKGIVEWGWDLVYVSWACALGSAIFGSKVWYLFLVVSGSRLVKAQVRTPSRRFDLQVPGFAGYKVITLVGPYVFPSLFRRSAGPIAVPADNQRAGKGVSSDDGEMSKRQAKLKARAERGDKRVRGVERRQ